MTMRRLEVSSEAGAEGAASEVGVEAEGSEAGDSSPTPGADPLLPPRKSWQ